MKNFAIRLILDSTIVFFWQKWLAEFVGFSTAPFSAVIIVTLFYSVFINPQPNDLNNSFSVKELEFDLGVTSLLLVFGFLIRSTVLYLL